MKEEKKADIYYLKVPTFRRTVQLHIGWDKEYFDRCLDRIEKLI